MLELSIVYNNKDFENFHKECFKIKKVRKQMFSGAINLFIIISLLCSLGNSICKFGGIFFNIPFVLFFCVNFILVYLIMYFLQFVVHYIWGGKAIILQRKGIKEESTLVIQDDILIDSNGEVKTEYLWKNIKTIYNAKNNILIFVSDMMAVIIPKRIFGTRDDLNNCWDYIQRCYNNSRNAV